MDLLKFLKSFVFIFSFVMFCYQLNTATLNFMDPPTVLSQHERDITANDMPLISICSLNQTSYTRMWELGYFDHDDLLMGYAEFNETSVYTSWGAHMNLTFENLIGKSFYMDRVKYLSINGAYHKNTLVFLPSFGFCKKVYFLIIVNNYY